MTSPWIIERRRELLGGRGNRPAWGNHPGGLPYVEPTALAALALAAADDDSSTAESQAALRDAAAWLAGLQQRDGALGIAPDLPQPRWTTPLGILVWAAAEGTGEA